MTTATTATIYHNPRCGTSRTTLAAIRDAGLEPTVVEYLKTPPTVDELRTLVTDAGLTPRDAVRTKESVYAELGLANADDEALLAAMAAHPILIERPFVVTDRGTVLARPADRVSSVL